MLAWDDSENAAAAYGGGPHHYSAELVAVSVTHAPEHAELAGEKERALDENRAFYARKLEPLPQEAKVSCARLRHEVVPGDHPTGALLRSARDEAFDLIVVGRRGLGRSSWFQMGSVTDRVARYAPCPVVVFGRGE
jgi:nucleotide-binding universal stress UspA family protein